MTTTAPSTPGTAPSIDAMIAAQELELYQRRQVARIFTLLALAVCTADVASVIGWL